MGNVKSVQNALNLLGETVEITDDPRKLKESEAIILPGVGAFGDGMNNLRKKNLIEVLNTEIIDHKKPYLGICLGLQFLADRSFEKGEHNGLGWIKSEVVKIQPENHELKIPHMGWNDTEVLKTGGLLDELENPVFYYLHSYYLKLESTSKDVLTSVCNYGGVPITATIQHENIYAVQFHPEKSQTTGIKLLKNFLNDIRKKDAKK